MRGRRLILEGDHGDDIATAMCPRGGIVIRAATIDIVEVARLSIENRKRSDLETPVSEIDAFAW